MGCSFSEVVNAVQNGDHLKPVQTDEIHPLVTLEKSSSDRFCRTTNVTNAAITQHYNPSKTSKVRSFIRNSLANNEIFKNEMNLRGVDEDSIQDLISAMNFQKFQKNDVLVVEQGNSDNDCLYVISRGTFSLYDGSKKVGSAGPGDVVGDTWFFGRCPTDCAVRASKGAEAYILPMSIFLSIVGKGVLFSQIEILEGLDDDQLRLLKSTVSLETHKKGDIIFKEGDPGHSFYIILSGLVEISYDMSDTDPGLGDFNIMLGLGGWFGEEPLLLGGRQTSTATAASVMTLCRVPAETFNDHELFGPVHDRLKSDIDMSKVVNHARHFSRRISPTIFSTLPKKRRPTSFALSGAGNIGGSGWNRQLSRSPRNSLYGLTSMHLIIGNVFADLDGFSSMHPEDSPRLNTERSIGERRASAASVLTSNGSFVYPSRETSHTNANSITIADTFDMRVQHAFAIDSRRNSNESSSDGSILIRTPLSVSAKHRLVPRLEAVQCSKSDKSSWSTDLKDSIDITLKDGQSFVIVDQSDVRDILRNAEGQHTDPTSAIATRRCSHTSSGSSVVFTARSSDDDNDSSLYAGHEQVPVQVQLHGEGDREDGVVARNQTMASVKGEEEEIEIGELPGTKPRQGTEDTIKMEELSSSSGEASPSSSASSLSDDERTTDIRASDFVAAD